MTVARIYIIPAADGKSAEMEGALVGLSKIVSAAEGSEGVEDGADALLIDVIGAVARDRVRDEVRRKLYHPRPRVVAPLLVQVHGESRRRLQQRREEKADRARAENVHVDPRGRCGRLRQTGVSSHVIPRSAQER